MMMMTMMDILKEQPLELEIGSSKESLLKVLESQKLLIHRQIDQFQSVVNTQCKLTGVNPLAQEMAAGALSIKIGKRPRDMLIPKALKYMQSVFSIKDAISKKETREISALFGVTVTQVREYFANQRSRVRKLARLSREKAIIREHTSKESQEHMLNDSDLMQPIDPVPLSTVGPSSADEAPSCSNQGEVLPGLGESEKQFVENIFSSMCKEETFSGQVKLMEWILRIENSSILCWFLTKGGVMILATWLSQAASEEQTTVLSVALKVLSHLPLHKAIPAHMSVIIQAVNKLRFYRISDISIRAKVLLSKWSKMLSKSLASRKPNGVKSAGVQEIDLSQRIGELIGDDSWQPSIDNPDGALVPSYLGTDDIRKMESQQAVKLLTAADDSNKKNILGSSAIQNKERRKVLLVEQPGQKAAAKSQPVRAVAVGQARPITADEIQKAKLRAQLMQSGKSKPEGPKKPSLLTNDFLSASEAYLRPKLEAQKKARVLPPKNSTQVDSLADEKRPLSPKESLLDKCRRVRISWRTPPEIKLDESWSIGTGESSKEIEVQKNRMRREKETIYQTLEEVPPNPKDPWDIEMDYDDSLTPEVPLEQVPDGDSQMADLTSSQNPSAISPGPPSQSGSGAEPDLELLAVLLKNPELVFALAKGEAGLSSEDTVRLLDMLKSNGQPGMLNGTVEKVEVSLPSPTPVRNVEVSLPSPTPPSRVEVSLPSPTPSSNPGPSGWATTQTTTKNPFSRLSTAAFNGVQSTVIASDRLQFPAAVAPTLPSLSQQLSSRAPMADPQASSSLLETHPTFFNPASAQIPQSVNHQPPLNSSYSISYSHPHLHDPYEVPENSSHNRAMLNSARQGSVTNSIHARVDQNGYDPVALPGTSRERNEYYPTARTGYESWSPEDSPSRYQPEHRLQVQQGWRYQDQRGRGYGPPPPDRNIRYQNLGGVRDSNWYGGGRRWQDGDRRR